MVNYTDLYPNYDAQFEIFERLSERLDKLLQQFSPEDSSSGLGDYLMCDLFLQSPQVKVSVGNLELFRPSIVVQLQKILESFPGWEIVYTVAVEGHFYDWPNMGLYIRQNEIIDTLQRQYFPKEFQAIAYEGARRMTEDDYRASLQLDDDMLY